MKTLLLMSLRGNAILYYGEELGLTQVDIPFDQLHDPEAIANWPLTLSRDGARTPMPWDESACAGFGSKEPWLPVGDANRARPVAVQDREERSLLASTRQAIELRRANPAMKHGKVTECRHDGDLLILRREAEGQTLEFRFNLGTRPIGLDDCQGRVLMAINGASHSDLPAYAAIITEISE